MRTICSVALLGMLVAFPGRAQTSITPEQQVINVEHAWNQAVINRDAAALTRIYADEYIGTDAEGMVWNKAQDIDIDTTGPSRLASYKLDDLKVRLYGDVAVVTGRNTTRGTLVGVTASGQYRFTDVFVKRDGRWQCVANQTTSRAFQIVATDQ